MKRAFGLSTFLILAALGARSQPAQARRHKLLSAPTYYIALWAQVEDENHVRFRGASNLPAGARIAVVVTDFAGDAWEDYSDNQCVSVNEKGLFAGELRSKQGMKFRSSLIFRADFYTDLCTPQPAAVLQALGKKGEGLANVEDGYVTELSGLSDNPQLYQVSGWYYGLEAIARLE